MMKKILLGLIHFYQRAISPYRPNCCRYYPTCSHYAVEAIETHGVWRGTYLTIRRLLRCHPFSRHGWYDPVPPRTKPKRRTY